MLADRTARLAVALALPLALTACGEKQRVVPSDKATPVAVASIQSTVFPAPTTPAPTTEAPTAGPSTVAPTSGGGGNAVEATATNTFDPKTLNVKVGAKVTWTASGFHTVTSGTPEAPDAAGPLQSPMGFTTFEYTFAKAGTFKYFCQPHGSIGMVGEVVVS